MLIAKRRCQIYCARRASGITFIRYPKNRKIGKPKNVKEHPIIIRVQFGFYQVYVFQEIPFLHFPYGSMLEGTV
jgi:hypothetical protein